MSFNDLIETIKIVLTVGSWFIYWLLSMVLLIIVLYIIGKVCFEEKTDLIVAAIVDNFHKLF